MENRKLLIGLPMIIAIALVIGIFAGREVAKASFTGISGAKGRQVNKLNQIINYITSDYVDTIQEEWIMEETINGLLSKLDPHSAYIPGDRFNELNDPLEGNFEGIGVEFRIENDTVVVVNPITGGPSEKVGVQAGDRIVEVEGEAISGPQLSNQKVMKLLKGPEGTEVNIGVYRSGHKEIIPFEIKRDEIPIYSVEAAYMLDDEIAYIKIIRFARTTFEEFNAAVQKLQSKGMKKLLIDLRNNSGGYMQAATQLADAFLEKDKLIVYTQGKARKRQDIYASNKGELENLPLVVLINENSASASEILAGALQDNDRGTIIGRRSFGKGLVQEPMQWSDGSQIRLTVARYYTPTGRSIQKPYEDGIEAYQDEYYDRYNNGELFSADSIDFPDSLKYRTPAGKIVYGGGGIMPDIFVPIDTLNNSNYFSKLLYTGMFYQFGFQYVDANRKQLLGQYDAEKFLQDFPIDAALKKEFFDFADERGISFEKDGALIAQSRIENRLRAAIGRNLFGDEVFYAILNEQDLTVKRAVKVLSQKKPG